MTPAPLSTSPWGVLACAALRKLGITEVELTPQDLAAADPWDLDVVDGPDGAGVLRVIPPRIACRYCAIERPLAAWDEAGWHELPERGPVTEAWCCPECWARGEAR